MLGERYEKNADMDKKAGFDQWQHREGVQLLRIYDRMGIEQMEILSRMRGQVFETDPRKGAGQ